MDSWGEGLTQTQQDKEVPGALPSAGGEGRGAVSLRGTWLGVKGFVGPMSVLHAVNMRGLRLAGSRVLQVFREMPGKMTRMAEWVWTGRQPARFGVRSQRHVLRFSLLRAAVRPAVLRRWV